jgi:hypothetical protein
MGYDMEYTGVLWLKAGAGVKRTSVEADVVALQQQIDALYNTDTLFDEISACFKVTANHAQRRFEIELDGWREKYYIYKFVQDVEQIIESVVKPAGYKVNGVIRGTVDDSDSDDSSEDHQSDPNKLCVLTWKNNKLVKPPRRFRGEPVRMRKLKNTPIPPPKPKVLLEYNKAEFDRVYPQIQKRFPTLQLHYGQRVIYNALSTCDEYVICGLKGCELFPIGLFAKPGDTQAVGWISRKCLQSSCLVDASMTGDTLTGSRPASWVGLSRNLKHYQRTLEPVAKTPPTHKRTHKRKRTESERDIFDRILSKYGRC